MTVSEVVSNVSTAIQTVIKTSVEIYMEPTEVTVTDIYVSTATATSVATNVTTVTQSAPTRRCRSCRLLPHGHRSQARHHH